MFRAMLVAGFALVVTGARAAEKSGSEIKNGAEIIAKILAAEKLDQVAIEPFRPLPQFPSGGGTGLVNDLMRELSKLGIECTKNAHHSLAGRYALDQGKLTVKVKCSLLDEQGDIVSEPHFILTDPEYVTRLFGITAAIPPNESGDKRKEIIREAIDLKTAAKFKPAVKVSEVKPRTDSDYGVEIWVLKSGIKPDQAKDTDYAPRECRVDKDGLAYVDLRRGEIFAVRLINNSNLDAAATITLDGVNSFAFQENSSQYKHYIVSQKLNAKPALIKGWFRNEQESDAFTIGEYAKGAFQELNLDPGSVGTITVTYSAAWDKGAPPPNDELSTTLVARGKGNNAVGRGPAVGQIFKAVEKNVGVIRAAITIRYQN